ncbi:hypothetical protein ACFLYP_00310 [Chloroflexota bacterium]
MLHNPKLMLVVGFILLVIGVVFPFLMVVRAIPNTFWLNFVSYGASVSGLLMGTVGVVMYGQLGKK